jgi:hypothetical protein
LAQVGVPNVDQVSFSFARTPEAFLRIIPTQPYHNVPDRNVLDSASDADEGTKVYG